MHRCTHTHTPASAHTPLPIPLHFLYPLTPLLFHFLYSTSPLPLSSAQKGSSPVIGQWVLGTSNGKERNEKEGRERRRGRVRAGLYLHPCPGWEPAHHGHYGVQQLGWRAQGGPHRYERAVGPPHLPPWVPLIGDLMGKGGDIQEREQVRVQERHPKPQSQLDIDSDFDSAPKAA